MTRPVGPRGLSVLIFIGLVALALAVVGWTQRGNGEVGPLPHYSSAGIAVSIAGGGTAGGGTAGAGTAG